MVRESRHLWVGNLPENARDDQIIDYFSRYGRVEKVKILPKKSPDGGLAAFVDFVDIRSATKANENVNYMGDRELRTNYNEPGGHPGMGRGRHHMYDKGPGDYGRRDRGLGYPGEGRGRFPYRDDRRNYPMKRPRLRRESSDSQDVPLRSPAHPRKHSESSSSDSDADRSGTPENESYSESDGDERDKSVSPARSSVSSQSVKNFSIQIKNLSTRTSDTSLQEALFHEFKKIGEIANIKIVGTGAERFATVKFRRREDMEKALQLDGKVFLGNELKLSVYKGDDKDKGEDGTFSMYKTRKHRKKEHGTEELPFDPAATRTLFVGNLEKTLMHSELRKCFDPFGDVVDVDIKKQNQGVTTYAFIQYVDIQGAMRGKKRMDREFVGRNRVKVGYGRGTPTNTIWCGNLAQNITEGQLQRQFHQFGYVTRVMIDRQYWQALTSFDTIDAASFAFADMHGRFVLGKRLMVDYASRSCKDGFYSRMERTGQIDRRTLEPSPPPRGATPQTGPGVRGGFQRRGTFPRMNRGGFAPHGHPPGYGPVDRGPQVDYHELPGPRGPPDYYRGGDYIEPEDGDDYEKELREYGRGQRERERETEKGNRPERDHSRGRAPELDYERRNRGGPRPREGRNRAYTPLSDDEKRRGRNDRDVRESSVGDKSESEYSEKEVASKVVKAVKVTKKRKRSDEEKYADASSDHEEPPKKTEKKEKKKKKEKKEKSSKKKGAVVKPVVETGYGKDVNEDEEGAAEIKEEAIKEEGKSKSEKAKKKRRLSEKGLTAEEKARKRELKKLKKLKKLKSEDEKAEELQSEVGPQSPVVKATEKESYSVDDKEELVKNESEATEDFCLEKEDSNLKESVVNHERPPTPPTPGLEEDIAKEGERLSIADEVKSENENLTLEEIKKRKEELERLEELEKKREELRRLEELEKKKDELQKIEELERRKAELLRQEKLEKLKEEVEDLEKQEKSKVSDNKDEDRGKEDIVTSETTEVKHVKVENIDLDIVKKEEIDVEKEEQKITENIVTESKGLTEEPSKLDLSKDIKVKEGVQDANRAEEVKNILQIKKKEIKEEKEESKSISEGITSQDETKIPENLEQKDDSIANQEDQKDTVLVAEAEVAEEKKTQDSIEPPEDTSKIDKGDLIETETPSTPEFDDDDDIDDEKDKENFEGGKTPPTPDLEEDRIKEEMRKMEYEIMYGRGFDDANRKDTPTPELTTDSDKDIKRMEDRDLLRPAGIDEIQKDTDSKRSKKTKKSSPVAGDEETNSRKTRKGSVGRRPSTRKGSIDKTSNDEQERSHSSDRKLSPTRRRKSSLDRSDSTDSRTKKIRSPEYRESPDRRDSSRKRRGSLDTISKARTDSPDTVRSRSPERRDPTGDRSRRDSPDVRTSSDRRSPLVKRGSPDRFPLVKRGSPDRFSRGRGRDDKDFRPERRRDDEFDRDNNRDRMGRGFRNNRDDLRKDGDRIGYDRDRNFDKSREFNRGRDAFRDRMDRDRPRHRSPPSANDRRSHSPPKRYQASGTDRRPRSPDRRRPASPDYQRSRSPLNRGRDFTDRRQGRSAERKYSPVRQTNKDTDVFHKKDNDKPIHREPDRRERDRDINRREKAKDETPPPPPPPPEPRGKEHPVIQPPLPAGDSSAQMRHPQAVPQYTNSPGNVATPSAGMPAGTTSAVSYTTPPPPPSNADTLLDLLRRYPVMWQGLFALKNDSAAVQMHYLSGNVRLAEASLPRSAQPGEVPPPLRISQRMKLEPSQLEGVNKRIQAPNDHCMLLALPCGRDPLDVHAQTRALKTGFITYLQVKQAAGIINIINSVTKQPAYVLHIFPPCEFAQAHLATVAPDLLDSAADSGHLMVLITPV